MLSLVQKPNPSLLPLSFELFQNYPNPFNNKTVLNFYLHESYAKVTLNIFNIKGQLVATLLNEQLAAGFHRVIWNGTDENGEIVSTGVYLYRIRVSNLNQTGKMILLR